MYLDFIREKQIDEMNLHDTGIPQEIWRQVEGESQEDAPKDPPLSDFDPHTFLLSRSTDATEQIAKYGVQPEHALFCCDKIRSVEKIGVLHADASVQNYVDNFIRASSIRLRESSPPIHTSPNRLISVMDSKLKKSYWFYVTERAEDNSPIKTWEEFERAEWEPEWLFNKTMTKMEETYSRTIMDKKPLFCSIHGQDRWAVGVIGKDVQVQQRNTTEWLLTQPHSSPSLAVSNTSLSAPHVANKK